MIINKLQNLLKEKDIAAYIVPTSDFHLSEYISDYFKARAYLSGFTGSAGTLLVTKNDARLWTDGRYFIQAEHELQGQGVSLMKMGHDATINDFLKSILSDGETIAFDGRLLQTTFVKKLKGDMPNLIFLDIDLIDGIWPERPSMPKEMIYQLDDFFAGTPHNKKIEQVRSEMKKAKADTFVLSSLEDQAWLYNLRGNDVKNTPVFLAFSVITENTIDLFLDECKLNKDIKKLLVDYKITLHDYNEIYSYLLSLKGKIVLIDEGKVNYTIYESLKSSNTIINKENPTLLLKAIKNETEIKNTKYAHIKDGVAMVKAIYHLKTHTNELSEISFSDFLQKKREAMDGFIELSFNTIAGFKEHGAMMHYSATSESDYQLNDCGSFFLVDSGAHYLDGTTDITRTFALGKITNEMKLHYTTVLKSVIALASATFLEGCRGINLDILARGPIWKLLIDYKCGTGHGVGHILSVHEAPNGFRWQIVPERNDSAILVPGMITTDEPGIYLENKYGIRIENELLCVKRGESEFGSFLEFKTITVCPIDLDAVDPSLLTQEEKNWLNTYHHFVYDTLSKYLEPVEKEWLKENTRDI